MPNSAVGNAVKGLMHKHVCLGERDEAAMRQREKVMLGDDHAEQHAKARAHKCRIALGLEKVEKLVDKLRMKLLALPPSQVGQWSEPIHVPVAGIASVLLHTGKVLFWSYDPAQYRDPNSNNTGLAYLWDPATRTGRSITPPENIFCAGQTILSDGRVFIAGGNLRYPDSSAPPGQQGWKGAVSSYTFNPVTEKWVRQPDMAKGRWYPTLTQLADNRVVITSGYVDDGSQFINQSVEVFTPSGDVNGVGSMKVVSTHNPTQLYPLQFLLASGRMLQAGPNYQNVYTLQPSSADTWNWTQAPAMRASRYGFTSGIIYTDASVSPAKQLVMVAGGATTTGSISMNEWMNGNYPSGGWSLYPQWLKPRHNGNTVILADGSLFTVGGNYDGYSNYGQPIFQSELYNKPAGDPSGSWVEMAPHTIQAAYHSSALLLPDGTVLLSEDDMNSTPAGAADHMVQIYSPPYLFKGPRPVIQSAPASAKPGQTVSITANTSNIAKAVLVAPGAVTHANDMHQRFIQLRIQKSGNTVTAAIPNSAAIVPPGYYMLFVIDDKGVPSVSKFVRIA